MQKFLCNGFILPNCKVRLISTIIACRRLALGVSGKHFLYIVCFMLFGIGVVRSQSRPDVGTANNSNITPLNIGDQIPDELWNTPLQVVNHPEGKETITLADYKGKLIILDFWATWCTPCIQNFPKLNDLQNEFGDQIKVLAVTKEDKERINKFFTTGVGQEYTYLNTVVNDHVLSQYITYRSVPHIAWIGPNGKLTNTTQATEVTRTNIQGILVGHKADIVAKIDIDANRPLFISEHFNEDLELKAYTIFSRRYYPGLPMGNKTRKTKDGKIYGRQMTNASIMNLYNTVAYALFEKNGEVFNTKRAIIEVSDPVLLNHIEKNDGSYETHNLYNYELIVPENIADSIVYYMLEDLNRYSDYIGSIEKRLIDCLVLVRTSNKDKIESKGEKTAYRYSHPYHIFINRPIGHMINIFNDDNPIKLPIIDETGYAENIDIHIFQFNDLESLRTELNKYDLDVVPAKRSLNMLVLKDK